LSPARKASVIISVPVIFEDGDCPYVRPTPIVTQPTTIVTNAVCLFRVILTPYRSKRRVCGLKKKSYY
jgi:hypothetical protein